MDDKAVEEVLAPLMTRASAIQIQSAFWRLLRNPSRLRKVLGYDPVQHEKNMQWLKEQTIEANSLRTSE